MINAFSQTWSVFKALVFSMHNLPVAGGREHYVHGRGLLPRQVPRQVRQQVLPR